VPQIETWPRLPAAIRDPLVERMHDRNVGLDDLNRLRVWLETRPNVPEGPWFKDLGSFKLCGEGKDPKTFLLAGQEQRAKNSRPPTEGSRRSISAPPPVQSNYAACIIFFIRSFMSCGETSSMCVATPHRCPNGS
jgi:hypothetical protein